MSEWPQKTLGDLIRVKHGWAFKGEFFSEPRSAEVVGVPGWRMLL